MKKTTSFVIALGIFFLFLIQMAGTLVESIYILDLMNTSLDEKVLGLLFFFTPGLLYFYKDKRPALTAWILFVLLFLARGVTPYLNTLGRMLSSGIGIGAALTLLPFLFTAWLRDEELSSAVTWISAGLALAGGMSVFLRTVNYGLDFSLFPEGGWTGWLLSVILGMLLTQLDWGEPGRTRRGARPVTLSIIGIFLAISLVWFAFSAPSVISRWTEGDYRGIVILVSAFSLAWVGISLAKASWIENISRTGLLFLNLLFAFSLTLTLLAHRVPFPEAPESPSVVVGAPMWFQIIPLAVTLILFPVIFLNVRFFSSRIRAVHPAPRDLVPGILLGSLLMVILVFIHIFTNVWGYVEPVSLWFRNLFWLPFALITGLLTLLSLQKRLPGGEEPTDTQARVSWLVWVVLGILFIGTFGGAFYTTRAQTSDPREDGVLVMTYNIQAANNDFGERSVEEQLALIRDVGPDILALQESDTTRVSLNNNDFVRYFAGKLGYYSYFGPTTTTGTYGTAILSKYPLKNARTVFTYSDKDEIGTAEVEVAIGGEVLTIFNVHPAGSDTVKLVFAESILKRSAGKQNVISLGDYNLRDYEEAYQLIDEVFNNAWVSNYPSEIGPDGLDMSGENRIDHIFISQDLKAEDPVYILPPESATDHPVHWAVITWGE
jgi:endonuclease/exonuclease/phosphatase family metal-dependent hydrolase